MTDDRAVIDQIDTALRDVRAPLHDLLPAATVSGTRMRRRRHTGWAVAGASLVTVAVVAAGSALQGGPPRAEPAGPVQQEGEATSFTPVVNDGLTPDEAIAVLGVVAPELDVDDWYTNGAIEMGRPGQSWADVNGDSLNPEVNGFELLASFRNPSADRAACGRGEWERTACERDTLPDGSTLAMWTMEGPSGFQTNWAMVVRPDEVTISAISQNYRASIEGEDNGFPSEPSRDTPLYSRQDLVRIVTAPEWSAALGS